MDHHPADPQDDHRWLSYQQLAEARGISRASAIRLVRKLEIARTGRRWSRAWRAWRRAE